LKTGIVIKSTGSNYLVSSENQTIMCKIRGKFRMKDIKTTNPIAVGDIVDFEILEDAHGFITKIHQRRNYIIRKSTNLSKEAHILASNIDQAIIIVTLIFPITELQFIDRFLVTAEAYKIPAKIIFNKIDLYSDDLKDYMHQIANVYQKIGYECFEISVKENINLEQITELLKNKTSVISGNSGVGKSSLVNAIDITLNLKTSEISDMHMTGKHTTTFAEMFELKTGGYIIDTPGIKGFGVVDMQKNEISNNFPEMFELLHKCKFYNCSHVHEPHCAVKQAVELGEIADFRYASYVSLMEGDDEKYRENIYK